jgi:hypothetical protein
MMKFQNTHAADMAWAIASPPLLLSADRACTWYSNDWYQRAGSESAELMRDTDNHPEQLEAMLAEQLDRRLGNYFETLWAYWLSVNPRFELVGRNLQINEQGRTFGELDFIVYDRSIGKYLHWEVAVKFYLGRGDTGLQRNWLGPRKKDRLDLKVAHLLNRQLTYGSHPRVRQWCDSRGIRIDACAVILKGRLFYPLDPAASDASPRDASPRHLRGRWLTFTQFRRTVSPTRRFVPLIHGGWLAAPPLLESLQAYSAATLLEMIESGTLVLPVQLCGQIGPTTNERLFIVENGWGDD